MDKINLKNITDSIADVVKSVRNTHIVTQNLFYGDMPLAYAQRGYRVGEQEIKALQQHYEANKLYVRI